MLVSGDGAHMSEAFGSMSAVALALLLFVSVSIFDDTLSTELVCYCMRYAKIVGDFCSHFYVFKGGRIEANRWLDLLIMMLLTVCRMYVDADSFYILLFVLY